MKTYIVILGVLLSVTADAAQAESFESSQEAYRSGIEQFQLGHLRSSTDSFYKAIELAPEPEASPTEYLPYLNLSISLFEMGDTRAARDALIQSQIFGVAAETEKGNKLLEQYAADIMSAPLDDSEYTPVVSDDGASADKAVVAEAENDASISLADDASVIKEKSIRRCLSAINKADDDLPWFFYYQCGMDLMERGDALMAVNAFEMGAKAVDDPRRGKRMYGMWFVDYLPYYQMALAHSQLGNWESANSAMKTSENHGEFSPTDPDYEDYSALDALIKSNLQSSGS